MNDSPREAGEARKSTGGPRKSKVSTMAVKYKDYYALLGVDRKADNATISKAFKAQAKKYHPDLNPGDKKAEEKFKDVNEAYEVLKDPKKRQLYDQLGPNWQAGQQFNDFGGFGGSGSGGTRFTFNGQSMNGSGFSDFFESLFGSRVGQSFGGFKTGGGQTFGGFRTSAGSFGGGFDGFGQQGANPFQQAGRDIESELELSLEEVQAGGQRSVSVRTAQGVRSYTVRVPAGVREGAKLRLAGKGETGPGGSGDLLLKVVYRKHPYFTVDGSNLECDLPVAPWVAVLGGKVRVRTLDGDCDLNLPQGSGSGRRFRLRGRGLGAEGSRGDLYVRVMITAPERLTDAERRLWQQLAEVSAKA